MILVRFNDAPEEFLRETKRTLGIPAEDPGPVRFTLNAVVAAPEIPFLIRRQAKEPT